MHLTTSHSSRRSILHRLSSILILVLTLLLPAGCQIFGIAAQALPKRMKAAYPDLKNQQVAVMVTADRAVRMDFPSVLIDCTNAIQLKMQRLQNEEKPPELQGIVWLHEPRSVVRYQRDHPELDLTPATEIAQHHLKVTRLIFVEIERFSTRSEHATQLFKGKLSANLRVIEVKDGKAKEAYAETGVTVQFPPRTREGIMDANDYAIYRGTVDLFSTTIMNKFVEHDID